MTTTRQSQTMDAFARIAIRSAEVRAKTTEPTYTLAGVVEAARAAGETWDRARRDALRDHLWGAVEAGTYPDFDAALEAYATGQFPL